MALQRKGVLEQDPHRSRTYRVRPSWLQRHTGGDKAVELEMPMLPSPVFVPVLGRIAAGVPVLAEEVVEEFFPLPRELVGDGALSR